MMTRAVFILVSLFWAWKPFGSSVFAQVDAETSKVYYRQALGDLRSMLEGNSQLSFKQAVFITENAYFGNTLSLDEFQSQIDILVYLSHRVIRSGDLIYEDNDREAVLKNWAIYRVMKDTLYLVLDQSKDSVATMQTTPYTYDFEDFWGEKDWTKMFVSKLLKTHTGNCHSLPFLAKILADEVGAKTWLAMAPNHTYLKSWSRSVGWYNTELTSGYFPIDAWIMASGYIKLDAIQNGVYMDTLSRKQSIAVCVTDLAEGYKAKFGYSDPEFLIQCADLALSYYPKYVNALLLKAETMKVQFESMMKKIGATSPMKALVIPANKSHFEEMEQLYLHILNLGYRTMPKEMYLAWLNELEAHKEKYSNKKISNFSSDEKD